MSTEELLDVAYRALFTAWLAEGYDFSPWPGVTEEQYKEFLAAWEAWAAAHATAAGKPEIIVPGQGVRMGALDRILDR